MDESGLERKLAEYIRAKGGRCVKLTGYKGIPDRMVLVPGRRVGFVELKSPTGRGVVAPAQGAWLEWLRDAGFLVAVSGDWEAIRVFVDAL